MPDALHQPLGTCACQGRYVNRDPRDYSGSNRPIVAVGHDRVPGGASRQLRPLDRAEKPQVHERACTTRGPQLVPPLCRYLAHRRIELTFHEDGYPRSACGCDELSCSPVHLRPCSPHTRASRPSNILILPCASSADQAPGIRPSTESVEL